MSTTPTLPSQEKGKNGKMLYSIRTQSQEKEERPTSQAHEREDTPLTPDPQYMVLPRKGSSLWEHTKGTGGGGWLLNSIFSAANPC